MRDHEESYLMKTIANIQMRFQKSPEIAKLNKAISLLREALQQSAGRPASLVSSLAVAVLARFNRTNQLRDLDEAICLFREVLELPHEDRPDLFGNLCAAMLLKFHASSQPQAFTDAVAYRLEMMRLEFIANGGTDAMFRVCRI